MRNLRKRNAHHRARCAAPGFGRCRWREVTAPGGDADLFRCPVADAQGDRMKLFLVHEEGEEPHHGRRLRPPADQAGGTLREAQADSAEFARENVQGLRIVMVDNQAHHHLSRRACRRGIQVAGFRTECLDVRAAEVPKAKLREARAGQINASALRCALRAASLPMMTAIATARKPSC
jgi:hypothetical protein